MKYILDPSKMFKKYDRLVVYWKSPHWHLYTYTSGYKLLKRDKNKLIEYICKEKKVEPDDVKFIKWGQIIGEDV